MTHHTQDPPPPYQPIAPLIPLREREAIPASPEGGEETGGNAPIVEDVSPTGAGHPVEIPHPHVRQTVVALERILAGESPCGALPAYNTASPSAPTRGPAQRATTERNAAKRSSASAAAPASRPTRATDTDTTPDTAPDVMHWPSGPLIACDLFRPDEVQRLIEAILTDETIMQHPSMPGLTPARLRTVARHANFDPARFGRFTNALIHWFTHAGIIVEADQTAPHLGTNPWPLISSDRVVLRRKLHAVAPPDGMRGQ